MGMDSAAYIAAVGEGASYNLLLSEVLSILDSQAVVVGPYISTVLVEDIQNDLVDFRYSQLLQLSKMQQIFLSQYERVID